MGRNPEHARRSTVALTPEEVARLAGLARIQLTEQECAELAPELDVILTSVHQVAEVAGPDVPLMTHALPLVNVTRPDVVQPSLTTAEALSGAPAAEDGRFRVPQILSED
ncbi:Asp-tRNA(Asn)/Glu-tRNA(Gln) amidotransferase subunit GatC [Tessaracoccus sp. OS52]|uniref:Asp-tRNA(Asn)/Glu-tRNA(Gln) amidotransferase subunit GatC n=1 Tax=Tessaracoccus sp. OS52 TaxID=2886691 RepID=UPI001D11C858|nr:Asp-tRNA(Asn)/Glu-tRNA(Gln) amidotransferase subunit GatC [Tessaracoccus sp. OS52]MCC2593029.1 Asp-tRNA(Asn)/Glu-tRNA(Gln) amidotransferase subunit GatC [Tessaracoccus sp. OS52]